MKKLLSALVAIAFVAVSAPAFAEEVNKADAPSAQKTTQDSSKKSSKKKSTKKTTKTDDKAAAVPAK